MLLGLLSTYHGLARYCTYLRDRPTPTPFVGRGIISGAIEIMLGWAYFAFSRIRKRSYRHAAHTASRLPPYHVEYTRTRQISQVKQRRARLVLGSETAWESRVC